LQLKMFPNALGSWFQVFCQSNVESAAADVSGEAIFFMLSPSMVSYRCVVHRLITRAAGSFIGHFRHLPVGALPLFTVPKEVPSVPEVANNRFAVCVAGGCYPTVIHRTISIITRGDLVC